MSDIKSWLKGDVNKHQPGKTDIKSWLKGDVKESSDSDSPKPTVNAIVQDYSIYRKYACDDQDLGKSIRTTYRESVSKKILFVVFCAVAIIIVSGIVITYGDYPISFVEVYQILWSHIWDQLICGEVIESGTVAYIKDSIVWNLRLPRIIVAIVAGFGLAVSGTVMQSTLKNPMADSYTTGVSSGALFGAAIVMTVGSVFSLSYNSSVLLCAFIFSLVPTALIALLSQKKALSATGMILAGMAVMYIFNACTTTLKLMADPDALSELYRWQVGTLTNTTWSDVPVMLVVVILGSIAIMFLSDKIDILASGDESAKSLGINAPHLRIICLVIVSLITASVVAFTGTIGFVGLVSPHIARIFIGSKSKYLVPAAGLFGALLMLVADYVGRIVISPGVLEVGVVTAFIGGPMFLYLLMRQNKEVWK